MISRGAAGGCCWRKDRIELVDLLYLPTPMADSIGLTIPVQEGEDADRCLCSFS